MLMKVKKMKYKGRKLLIRQFGPQRRRRFYSWIRLIDSSKAADEPPEKYTSHFCSSILYLDEHDVTIHEYDDATCRSLRC